MRTKKRSNKLFGGTVLFLGIIFTHLNAASTQMGNDISTVLTYEKQLQTNKYDVYFNINYLECEEVEGELVGSSQMRSVRPKGSISGRSYTPQDGYNAECRIIEFEKVYTLDNISKIITETNAPIGTKITLEYSLNGVDWIKLGYTTTIYQATYYVNNREVNFIKGEDLHSSNKFQYLKATTSQSAIDIFDVYINQEKFEPSRMIGIEYEQTVDIDNNTSLPKIIEVKAEIEDQTTNTYKLSIEDFKCDVNGIPFFFWKADEVMFIGTNEDYTEVKCIIDEGISGRKVPVKVYIGDALGHIGKYTVWLSSN